MKLKCILAFFAGFFACIIASLITVPILNRKQPAMMMDVYEDIRNL